MLLAANKEKNKLPVKPAYLFLLSCSLILSCHKNIEPAFSDKVPENFTEVFEQFWGKMSANYIYWDIDTTQWNNVYNKYLPVFKNLNLQNDADVKKSVSYFRQMAGGLIDGHYTINFEHFSVKDSSIFPALDRKIKANNFHSPFLYSTFDTLYLDRDFTSGKYINNANEQVIALTGKIQNRILYFHCNHFSLNEAYQSGRQNTVKDAIVSFFNKIDSVPNTIKGLIIDLRNNTGGDIADLNFFIGRMLGEPMHFGYSKYKSGSGPLDYTPWINAVVAPATKSKLVNIPIIVLADNYSFSLAEIFVMAIKKMPKSTFVGEATWGATGPVSDASIYNHGSFKIPGFLSVFTSTTQFKYIDNKIYEGLGITPDIPVMFNINSVLNKRDDILERAISLIP